MGPPSWSFGRDERKRQNKEDEKLEGKLGVMVIFFVILFVKFTLSLSF